jgi:hypothetical protein
MHIRNAAGIGAVSLALAEASGLAGRYVWSEPRWIREREGHHYTPYVLEKHGDRWHYRGGHWDDD